MKKEITVRGAANVKVKPNYVNILINLVTYGKDYSDCMSDAAAKIQSLKNALKAVAVDPEDLRTTDFGVDTDWKTLADARGNYTKRVFKGYKVRQDLKFGFDFDRERLVTILGAVAGSKVDPEFRVRFTVKDTSAVKEELFAKASENARKIAEGLCRGVGKTLGEIININYSWHEIDVYSEMLCDECPPPTGGGSVPDINPDDLEASDSVTFTWELI